MYKILGLTSTIFPSAVYYLKISVLWIVKFVRSSSDSWVCFMEFASSYWTSLSVMWDRLFLIWKILISLSKEEKRNNYSSQFSNEWHLGQSFSSSLSLIVFLSQCFDVLLRLMYLPVSWDCFPLNNSSIWEKKNVTK